MTRTARGDVEAALRPVVAAVQQHGAAVWMCHHLRKVDGEDGTAHPGSSHLVALVDVAVELRRPEGGNAPLNRRILRAISRFSETPEELVVELRPDGYRSLGGSQDVARQELRQAILDVLPGPGEDPIPLEARGGESVLARLKGQAVPRTTAYEVLTRLVEEGAVERTGTGKRGDPYKYRVASPGDRGQDSFRRTLTLYTTERKPAPDPQTPGACPDPGVDLLEGADLLATLEEEDAPEEPGPPPDLDLHPGQEVAQKVHPAPLPD